MRFKNFGLVIAAMFLLAACESTSVEEGASTGTGAQSGGTSTTSSSASGSGAGSMARASAIREGSPQDFVINVGDRVYYDLDKSNIRADQRAQLEKQAAWLKKFPAVHLRGVCPCYAESCPASRANAPEKKGREGASMGSPNRGRFTP